MRLAKLVLLCGVVLMAVLTVMAQKPPSYFNQYVTELDNSNLDAITADLPKAVTYTMVYTRRDCPKCRLLRDTVNKVAKELANQVSFTGVDIDDYGVDAVLHNLKVDATIPDSALPMLKLVTSQGVTDVDTKSLNVKTLKEAALAQLTKQSSIPRLTAATAKTFLDMKKNPLPKLLLFTAKKETPNAWRALGLRLSGKVSLAEIPKSEKKLARQFDVEEYPSILLVPADSALSSGSTRYGEFAVHYSGTVKVPALEAWVERYVAAPHVQKLPYLSDDSCMKAYCSGNPGLCTIIILPNPDNSEESFPKTAPRTLASPLDITLQNDANSASYVTTAAAALTEVSTKTNQIINMGYMYGKQNPLLATFGLSETDYPQVIGLSANKGVYTTMVGSFSYDALVQWLQDFASGKIRTQAFSENANSDTLPSLGDGNACASVVELHAKQTQQRYSSSSSTSSSTSSSGNPNADTNPPTDPFNMDNGLPKWSAPVRAPAKRGVLIHLSENNLSAKNSEGYSWENIMKRNIPVVVYGDDGDIQKKKEVDIAAKAANSMVLFVNIPCSSENSQLKNVIPDMKCGSMVIIPAYSAINVVEGDINARIQHARVYNGKITSSEIGNWVLSVYDDNAAKIHVPRINSMQEMDQYITTDVLMPKILLFSEKSKIPYLLKALKTEFHEYASVASISTKPEILSRFQVTSTPAVRILKPVLKPQGEGSFNLQMEMIPVEKDFIFYNNLAKMLDNLAKNRYNAQTSPKVNVEPAGGANNNAGAGAGAGAGSNTNAATSNNSAGNAGTARRTTAGTASSGAGSGSASRTAARDEL